MDDSSLVDMNGRISVYFIRLTRAILTEVEIRRCEKEMAELLRLQKDRKAKEAEALAQADLLAAHRNQPPSRRACLNAGQSTELTVPPSGFALCSIGPVMPCALPSTLSGCLLVFAIRR